MILSRRGTISSSIALIVAAISFFAVSAYALNTQGQPTTVLSDPRPGVESSYSFGTYMLTGQDVVFEYEITFPVGFDITNAVPVDPAASVVARDVNMRRLHLRLDQPWSRPDKNYVFSVSGIGNAPAGGIYPMPNLRFLVGQQNKPNTPPTWESLPAADIELLHAHLDMTVSTQLIQFELSPEIASPAQTVSVTVSSSHDYMITREVAGDAELFGLSVEGQASGGKPAGEGSFDDSYSASVPWSTEGDRTYTATVTYSIVQ